MRQVVLVCFVLAAAFAELSQPPKRSILFAAVAAEEQGLLGSKYFAAHPTIAPGKMAAVVNIDGINSIGRTRDVNVIGDGKSSLDEVVKAAATAQGRIVIPDQFPDRGSYYRSDQFSLARIGVPGVYLHSGIHVIDKPDGWGKEQLERWIETTYHQPSDEYSESMTLDGAIEDLHLLFDVAKQIADAPAMLLGCLAMSLRQLVSLRCKLFAKWSSMIDPVETADEHRSESLPQARSRTELLEWDFIVQRSWRYSSRC